MGARLPLRGSHDLVEAIPATLLGLGEPAGTTAAGPDPVEADLGALEASGSAQLAAARSAHAAVAVTQAPLGSEAEFNNDVVLRFKASERGAAAVLNPRYVVKCTE